MDRIFNTKYLNYIVGAVATITIAIVLFNVVNFFSLRKPILFYFGNKDKVTAIDNLKDRVSKIDETTIIDESLLNLYYRTKECVNNLKNSEKYFKNSITYKELTNLYYKVDLTTCTSIYLYYKESLSAEENEVFSTYKNFFDSSIGLSLMGPYSAYNKIGPVPYEYKIKGSNADLNNTSEIGILYNMSLNTYYSIAKLAVDELYNKKVGLKNE